MYEDLYYKLEDTEAYLRRIGMDPAEFKPDKEHLDSLLRHQHQHVPFDNLDVWDKAALPSLGIPDLFDKIVRKKRGGYCFEINGLLEAALRALGYECYSVEIKIVRGRDYMPPAKHRGVIVILDGKKHFCDVGLGFNFFPEATAFNAGYNKSGSKVVCKDGICEVFLLREDGSDLRSLWFSDIPADPVDFVNPNFCCSQEPQSPFRTRLTMVRMTPEGYRKSLLCTEPAPAPGAKYSPSFSVTVNDGSRVVSEKFYCGTAELEEVLLKDFGVDYRFE